MATTGTTRTLTLTALFAALMCVSAQLRLPLGPVPLTLQSFTACVAGYCLGPGAGVSSMLLYTAIGLSGLPVFAAGGGPGYILSPTFGYIVGFIACAAVTGFLARFNRRGSTVAAYLVMTAGLAGIYLPGVAWLAVIMHVFADAPAPVVTLLKAGVLLPLPGDLLTSVPAAVVSVRLRKKLAGQEHPVDHL